MAHLLFSYGTLQLPKVQLASFGRLLDGQQDYLLDYKLDQLEITDQEVLAASEQQHHPIAKPMAGEKVHGMVFTVTDEELIQSDKYEVDDYQRVKVNLESGKEAWCYVENSGHNFNLEKSIDLLSRTPLLFETLFIGSNHDWAIVNEGNDTWSAYDIIGHLIHGEKTDWIPRAKIILEKGEAEVFTPFDRFAQAEASKGKTTEALINEFKNLRNSNVEKLQSWALTEDQLKLTGMHPDLGRVTLKQLLSTWTIHDMVHLNQLSRVIAKHYTQDVGPWKAYSKILHS